MYCGFCWSKDHTIKNCPKTSGGCVNRLWMRCECCGSKEHNIEACPKTFSGNAARTFHPETVENDFVKDRK